MLRPAHEPSKWRFNMKKLKKPVSELVAHARSVIEEIDTTDAIKMVGDNSVQIVDLRDIRERQRSGFIPGSFHCPRGMAEFWVDPDSPYFKEIFATDKKFVFHCASGWRSALTVQTLNEMGFDAAHIKNGFIDWEKAGGPIDQMPNK